MRIGFVGAGRMGRPMVERLVAAGHEVTVLGRTPGNRDRLREAGAAPVAAAAETAAGADIVGVCVFSDEQVSHVGAEVLPAMPAGSVLVVHTTGSPATVRDLRDTAPGGVGVIDCPVSGGPHDIAAGAITLLAGGAAEHVDRARPALEAYGDPILHAGPLGAGQTVKLVNNAVFAANIGLLAAAARLGTRLGIEEKSLLTALTHGSAGSRALDSAARAGSVEVFAAAVAEFLSKDVEVVRATAAALGGDLGVLDAAIAEIQRRA
ncbi:MAG: NAD(P)-dependent oxidoreductase [Streptosporangiales bacterium]|nr:NAD(P)-dependent oxidoreductase [Streptosporangiales bacterium]